MWIEGAVIVLAGAGAGIINPVVGSGTLITFPVPAQELDLRTFVGRLCPS